MKIWFGRAPMSFWTFTENTLRRGGSAAGRDLPRHPEYQSGAPCDSQTFKGDWERSTVHRVGHDRADGDDAGWADGGSNVGIAAACQTTGVWHELRNGAGVHDRPHSNAKPDYRRVRVLLSECRLAG